MNKGVMTFFIFILIFHCATKAQVNALNDYKLWSLEQQFREEKGNWNACQAQVNEIQVNIAHLEVKIEALEKENDKRFLTLYALTGTIFAVILLVVSYSGYKANKDAKFTAQEEVSSYLKDQKDRLSRIEKEAIKLSESLKTQIEVMNMGK